MYVSATIPILSPFYYGPWNPQGQTYATPWLRHRGLRPIGTPHVGQGKVVEPLSTRGTPEAVHTIARSVIIRHLVTAMPRPPLLYGCVRANLGIYDC